MIALGIDPGANCGWGIVDASRVVGFGLLTAGDEAGAMVDLIRRYRPGLVVIETLTRVHPVVRDGVAGISTTQAFALYQAGKLAGSLLFCASLHLQAIEVTAEAWRGAVVGKQRASNAEIEAVLRSKLQGFPAARKSNNHHRDALGVAAFGAQTGGRA